MGLENQEFNSNSGGNLPSWLPESVKAALRNIRQQIRTIPILENGYQELKRNKKTRKTFFTISSLLLVFWWCVMCSIFGSLIPDKNAKEIGLNATATEIEATATMEETSLPTATNTPEPTIEPTPTVKPTDLFDAVQHVECIPDNERHEARVVNVIDGDTIEIAIEGKTYKLRYIGIDTPEKNPAQFMSSESSAANAELVSGRDIIFVSDVSETDSFGRLLGYVIADDIFVNRELVVQGFASAKEYPPDTACSQTFSEAMTTASAAGLGLWSVAPTTMPVTEKSNSIDISNCDPSYPDVCIAPPPPDLDCGDISYRRFRVTGSDPHNFDGRDKDGIGCES